MSTHPEVKIYIDSWISWHGGLCPLPVTTLCRIRCRNAAEEDGEAGEFDWRHDGTRADIIAYRFIEPASDETLDAVANGEIQPYTDDHADKPTDGVLTGAALHRAIADALDAGEGPDVFEHLSKLKLGFLTFGSWASLFDSISKGYEIRRKPTTRHLIDQNGVRHEWPEPMSKAPPHETDYWVSDLTAPSLVLAKRWQKWISTGYDIEMGIAHLRKKNAQAQSKALIAASGGLS